MLISSHFEGQCWAIPELCGAHVGLLKNGVFIWGLTFGPRWTLCFRVMSGACWAYVGPCWVAIFVSQRSAKWTPPSPINFPKNSGFRNFLRDLVGSIWGTAKTRKIGNVGPMWITCQRNLCPNSCTCHAFPKKGGDRRRDIRKKNNTHTHTLQTEIAIKCWSWGLIFIYWTLHDR